MEVDELINRYKVPSQPGLVNYREFINKLNEVFYEKPEAVTAVIQNARSSAVSQSPSQPSI